MSAIAQHQAIAALRRFCGERLLQHLVLLVLPLQVTSAAECQEPEYHCKLPRCSLSLPGLGCRHRMYLLKL